MVKLQHTFKNKNMSLESSPSGIEVSSPPPLLYIIIVKYEDDLIEKVNSSILCPGYFYWRAAYYSLNI